MVELSVRRSHGATWEPEPVEQEIFQRLSQACFPIEPVENWGFLSFLNDSVSVAIPKVVRTIADRPTARTLVCSWRAA